MRWSKNKIIKFIVLLIVLFSLGAYLGYQMVYQPHKSIEKENAVYSGTAKDFIQIILTDHDYQWQNEVVEISGVVSQQDDHGIVLNQQIFCQMNQNIVFPKIEINSEITIKGRYIGYDSLLEEIRMDQCISIN